MDFGSLFKKMILLLVFLQFILTQGQSQFYSKESNDKIIDSYFNLNINCILEILETPIEENSNESQFEYRIIILDTLKNINYKFDYSDQKIIEDYYILKYKDGQQDEFWYHNHELIYHFIKLFDSFGELDESKQYDKNEILVSKNKFYRDDNNRIVKTEVFNDKEEIVSVREIKYDSNNFLKENVSISVIPEKRLNSKTVYDFYSHGYLKHQKTINYIINTIFEHKYYYDSNGLLIKEERFENSKIKNIKTIIYLSDLKSLYNNYGLKLPDYNKLDNNNNVL